MDPVRDKAIPTVASTGSGHSSDARSATDSIRGPHFVPRGPVQSDSRAPHRAGTTRGTEVHRELVQLVNRTYAVFAWELRSFFLRPTSYLLLLAATLTAGWAFSWLVTLLSRGASVVLRSADDPIVQFLGPNVFLIGGCTLLVPLLTMNAIADERRRGTWEQLLTAPVSPLAVVLGKFLAAWSLLLALLAPWVYHLMVLRAWNGRMTDWHGIPWFDGPGYAFDLGIVWGGCIGLATVGATFVALGLFCSGLSRGPLSSAVLTLAVMGLVLLTALAPRVLAYWDFAPHQIVLVESFSCWGHIERFSRGVIEPRLVVGHLSFCSVVLWGTVLISRRVDEGALG